ncbi:MAG: colicin E3/pyocin S6 family cytotoxin [Gammaproteobacteria bacterium]
MASIPVPWKARFLSTLDRVPRRGEPRWRNATRDRFYEWDRRHGELEVYNNRGRHLGAVDPEAESSRSLR